MTFNFDVKTKRKLKGSVLKMVKMGIKDRKKLLFFAGIIMILLPVAYLTLKKPSTAEASWWTGGGGEWQKRKHLTITNDSTDDLAANTTVAVSLDTKALADGGKVRSNCADVRVVYQPNSTTQTELDRYLSYPDGESCETSGTTKIYFSLQAALTTGSDSEDYYVYFDNNEATPPSTQVDAFDIGSKNALLACPFDGTTTCINGDGTEDPTTESGAVRYGGGKSALSFVGNDTFSDAESVSYSGSNLDDLPDNDMTIEFWMYWKDNEANVADIPIAKRGSSPQGWRVELGENQKQLRFQTDCTTQNGAYYSAGDTVNYDEWTHIAVAWDASVGIPKLFINGIEPSYSQSNACTGGYEGDSGVALTVGKDLQGMLNQFPGVIDEVRISNTIRYTSNFTPQTTPFVRDSYTKLLYHFDEAGGDPRNSGKVFDDSGNGNHATIENNPAYVTGIVGIDSGSPENGKVEGGNAYAGHEGIYIEEETTNKVANPSFEHSTYSTGWTLSSGGSFVTPTAKGCHKAFRSQAAAL